MGSLNPSGEHLAVRVHFHTDEVPPRAGIGQCLRQHAGMCGQGNVRGPLPAPQGRPDQQQKGYQRRDGIPRQTKQELFAVSAKDEGTPGFNRDAPELQLPANSFKRAFDKIHLSHRNAARSYERIALLECQFQGIAHILGGVGNKWKDSWDCSRVAKQRR